MMTTANENRPEPEQEQEVEQTTPAAPEEPPGGKKKKGKKKKKNKKDRLGTKRGIETMFRTSYRQHVDLSAQADTKANIMISINGIIISIIIAAISPKINANPWLLIPTSVFLISCLVSMVYAVLAARPRVNSKRVTLEEVRKSKASLLFFGNFVNMTRADYTLGMTELMQNTDRLYTGMIDDIYSLGEVLARKFRLLRVAYTVFMIGLVLGVMLFIGVFIWMALSPASTAAGP